VIKIENLDYIIKNNKYNTCLCVECKTQEELDELLKQLKLDVKVNFKKPLHLKIILKGDGLIDIKI
jgi:hypothetical protein